jgi:hypothetical protein
VGFSRPCLHMQSRNLPADRDAGKSPSTPRSAYPMAGPCSTEARHDVDAARARFFLGDWRRPAIMQVWIKLTEQADEAVAPRGSRRTQHCRRRETTYHLQLQFSPAGTFGFGGILRLVNSSCAMSHIRRPR